MNDKPKVMLVDDSASVRQAVRFVLQRSEQVEVTAVAEHGLDAITQLEQSLPDVVLLDLEMPEMDGLSALRIISRRWPDLPVVVFSSLSKRGSAASIQALTSGAAECVLKPAAATPDEAFEVISRDVIPVLLAVTGRTARPVRAASTPVAPGAAGQHVDIVAIGSSTGGPMALIRVLTDMGPATVPVVIVQHMPPLFTADLAARLALHTGLDVTEAVDGEVMRPGIVRIAPGGLHLEIHAGARGSVSRLTASPPVNNCRPAVDPLFTTAVAAHGSGVFGVVLTGMGSDGADGARRIIDAGGQVIAQDEATSVVWGMPGAVVAAGAATDVLPVEAIGATIRRRLRHIVEVSAAGR